MKSFDQWFDETTARLAVKNPPYRCGDWVRQRSTDHTYEVVWCEGEIVCFDIPPRFLPVAEFDLVRPASERLHRLSVIGAVRLAPVEEPVLRRLYPDAFTAAS